jgi:hypothetical protein
MLKQHLDDVDRRIQEMLEFRPELTRRYMQLDDCNPRFIHCTQPGSVWRQNLWLY